MSEPAAADYPVQSIHIKEASNGEWYSVVVGKNNRILFDSGETYHNWDDCYDIVTRTWPQELFPNIQIKTNGKAVDREHPGHNREAGGRSL